MNDTLPYSVSAGRAALRMALTESREEENLLKAALLEQGINTVAVDYGGDFLPLMKKIIERAVVAAQRQGLVPANHVGEGAVAGAAKGALEQIIHKAIGFNVGGKIGIARQDEHITVAIYCSIGLLNLNQTAVALAHRSIALPEAE